MRFELLYFDDCPSWKSALKNLNQALFELDWQAEIQLVQITDDFQAGTQKFLGSPSIRYNRADLWPVHQDEYHLGCRVYSTPQGLKGAPTVEMIKLRLQELVSEI
jgi:hypothetical protein